MRLLAVVLALAAAAPAGPSLRVVADGPALVVRGAAFKPHARVTVTLQIGSQRRTRHVLAGRTGTFLATLGSLEGLDPCTARAVSAAGGGDRATLKLPLPLCPAP